MELLDKMRDPGFTPGRRDVPKLIELLATVDEDDATRIVRALAQVPLARERAMTWATAAPPQRHRLVMLAARAAPDDLALLESAVRDEDPRTRKAAARALGRVQNASNKESAAQTLAAALGKETRPEVKRALVEALGKVGDAKVLASLENVEASDELLVRQKREATLRIERGATRDASHIDGDREVPSFEIVMRCREGLEKILALEMNQMRVVESGRVLARVRRLRDTTAARLWSSLALPLYDGPDRDDRAVAEIISTQAPKLAALTEGPVRYRIEWATAGHRRAATRDVATQVTAKALINDPLASDWQIEIWRSPKNLRIEAVPKSWDDRRFAYRVADVPAASHPTIAAALARIAGVQDDDIVWDPFVGSGLELIERARLGPYRELVGTDTDSRALAAARRNVDVAQVKNVRLEIADARTFRLPNVTLVITNPPMGRRVQSGGKLDELLTAFLENMISQLRPKNRFVWITPRAKQTDLILKRTLRCTEDILIDMGGFAANLQRWERS